MKYRLQLSTIVKLLCTTLLLFMLHDAGIAQHTVSGTVIDGNTSEPLPGVSILVAGTGTGTTTNIDGNFQLNVASEDATLIFTFIGYERVEVPVQGRSQIDVEMQQSILAIDDIVVVGYGIQERASLTGSVGVADIESLQKRATASIAQALQGQLAGVMVQSAGHPGANPSVRIRGAATFGNNEPLYIIDNVPVDNLRDFNLNDIESIQVLKDASAAAVYGARASNGVVIITTNQGRSGTMNVQYETYLGRQDIPESRWYDVTGREDYQFLNNLARANVGLAPQAGNDPNSPLFVSDVDTDWQRETFTAGLMQNHNLTVSGGSDVSRFSVSGSFLEQEGTMEGPGPFFKRYTIRVNSDHEIGNFRFGESLFYSNSHQINQASRHTGSLVENIVKTIPTIPIFDENRLGGYGGASAQVQNAVMLNPIGANNLLESTSDRSRFLGNLWGEYTFLDNLTYKLNFNYDRSEFYNFWFEPMYDLGFFFTNNIAEMDETRGELNRLLIENTLHYQTNFDRHNFDVLAGYSEERNDFSQITGHAEGFTEPYFQVLDAGPDNKTTAGFRSAHNLRSFFGRLNYNFDDRYLLSATVRHDGSSRFAADNRYGTFPSVSAGWRINNESFFDFDFINELKIRASYGQVGNQDIGDYSSAAFINTNAHYVFGNQLALGAIQTSIANPNVKWETNITSDIGIDLELFNEKLLFTADYYRNESHDVLVGVPIPNHVGAIGNPTVNAANIRNTGFEFSLTYRENLADLSYKLSGNITTINNEVLSLGEQGEPIFGNGSRTAVGREIGELYGYVIDGIFQNEAEVDNHAFQTPGTAPGDYRFRDLDGDGVITSEDRTYLGSVIPDFYFGLNADFNYRSWDLSLMIQGTYGNDIVNRVRQSIERGHEYDNYPTYYLTDTWNPDNTNARLPRLAFGDPNNNQRMSERWIEDGSYIRLQNLQIGYTLPVDVISRIGINRLRFYLSGQNLFTITKYTGFDPDLGTGGYNNPNDGLFSRGVDGGSWPNPRILRIGLQLSI